MTRASLLHILNHVGGISEAEVRELEQLAAAFPYCQTAHVLLAKAAHDQGSMLASQRLRRAATYAVDRQLLRLLLEQPAPETTAEAVAPKELAAPVETNFSPSTAGHSTAFIQTLVAEDVQPLESPQDEPGTEAVEEIQSEADTSPLAEPVDVSTPAEDVAPTLPEVAASSSPETPLEEPANPEPDQNPPLPTAITGTAERTDAPPAEQPEAALIESTPSSLSATFADAAAGPDPASAADPDELLPAVAPPIRPPVEAGISRFEFGLSAPEAKLVPILYRLPGLEEEETTEDTEPAALVAATALAPPFRVDTDLAYGLLPEGSRCGYALQLRDAELTCALPATEFFPPDALLHAHSNQQPAATAPSSLDLINRFLKVQPRLKSPGILPTVQEQADLSARSTSAQPALASESLARILIKQGKPERAIKIYEQLMVRQPEKSAYFADQIQQLKTSE